MEADAITKYTAWKKARSELTPWQMFRLDWFGLGRVRFEARRALHLSRIPIVKPPELPPWEAYLQKVRERKMEMRRRNRIPKRYPL